MIDTVIGVTILIRNFLVQKTRESFARFLACHNCKNHIYHDKSTDFPCIPMIPFVPWDVQQKHHELREAGLYDNKKRIANFTQGTEMIFPCVRCGLCCRHVKKVPGFDYLDRGDGVCRYLKNRQCDIYENRPVICNVQTMYDLYYRDKVDKEVFFRENIIACIKLAEGNPEARSKAEAFQYHACI